MNTKGLGLKQLKVIYALKKGGVIVQHNNLDKHTIETCVEIDGDDLPCGKLQLKTLIDRKIIQVTETYNTQFPNTITTKYNLCTNSL